MAHNDEKTTQRVLATTGFNIRLLHSPDGQIASLQNGAYLQKQFQQLLHRAYNPRRKYQAQSIIVSFDRSEFDTTDLHNQAQQALHLTQTYVHKHFADAQSVIAIQADGEGGKLHAHILINDVKPNGKTVATNRFNVIKMRHDFDNTMQDNYKRITGRQWADPVHKQQARQDIANLPSKSAWKEYLKSLIDEVKSKTASVGEFLKGLADKGVTVTERQHEQAWTYHQKAQLKSGIKELKTRDFYQRKDRRTGEIISTRGLGQFYSKRSIEQYFNQKQQRSELKNGTGEQEKVKTIKRDAQVKRQSTKQQNVQRSSTKVEKSQQRNQQQARLFNRQPIRDDNRRRLEEARRKVRKAPSRPKSEVGGPEL